MKTLIRIILIVVMIYIIYKLGQCDLMINCYADGNYIEDKETEWDKRYKNSDFNFVLDVTLFTLFWVVIYIGINIK